MTKILLDYVENKLSPTAIARVEVQLETDAQAQETVTWLRQFQQWREQVQLPQPSQAVTEQIVAQHARKFSGATKPSLWQRVTAALTFDSWAGHLAGARGADLPNTRQLAYSTQQFDLLLDISHSADVATFDGQLLPKSEAFEGRYVVQLVHGDDEADTTMSDDLGEFSLTSALTGVHQLVVLGDEDIWFPELTV